MRVSIKGDVVRNPKVEVISSKSYAHRILIAAALSDKVIKVECNALSKDMEATADCLRAMGADIVTEGCSFIVTGIKAPNAKPIEEGVDRILDCGESGSTSRFLLPVAAAVNDKATLIGSGKLPTRPFGPLCDALRNNGCSVDSDYIPINVSGKLNAGIFEIPGDISSQFITGLLYTLPLLDGDSEIRLTTPLASVDYVNITIDVLKKFGIEINIDDKGNYLIKGNQNYTYDGDVLKVEADWSNAAFLMGIGALGGELTVTGLNLKSLQGDKEIANHLAKFGASISFPRQVGDSTNITVMNLLLKGITVDASNIPDMVPALSVVAAYANGDTLIKNVERLRIKESDRIATVSAIINALGGSVDVVEENGHTNMIIHPIEEYKGEEVVIDGANDHRIVMAASMAASVDTRIITIEGAEAVNKSYPGYFDILKETLGWQIQ